MSRSITPSRAAGSRPPFNSSTSVQQAARSTTPTNTVRRTVSPSANQRRRADGQVRSPPNSNGNFSRQSSARGGGGGDPTVINGLVTDLVNISQHLSHYVSEHSASSAGGGPSPGLKADEVERIVRRVELHYQEKTSAVIGELESHYQSKIAELEKSLREQKDLIVQLTKERNDLTRERRSVGATTSSALVDPFVDPIRNGITMRSHALSELERSWECDSSSRPSSAREGELQQLRQILLAEKRQRLLVEEQTQSLTEQHAKVVNTLESRIRKQENQMQQLLESFEQQQHNLTTAFDSEGRAAGGTPRSSKFRQRALRNDMETPRTVRTNHTNNTPRDSLIEVGLSSSRDSSPVAPPRSASALALPMVDDVTEFLENIAKELDSISNEEEARKSKLLLHS